MKPFGVRVVICTVFPLVILALAMATPVLVSIQLLDVAAVVGRVVVSGGVRIGFGRADDRAGEAAQLADAAAARLDGGVAETDGDAPVVDDAGGDGGGVVAAVFQGLAVMLSFQVAT